MFRLKERLTSRKGLYTRISARSTVANQNNSTTFRRMKPTKKIKFKTSGNQYNKQSKTDHKTEMRMLNSQKFQEVLKQVDQRGTTIYRLGFSCSEKNNKNRKTFAEYFDLDSRDLKGTMLMGQFWSNKEQRFFFQQNNIYVNKVKLIENIINIKKRQKMNFKNIQSAPYINSVGSLLNLDTNNEINSERHHNGFEKKRNSTQTKQKFLKNIKTMRKNLANLRKKTQNGTNLNDMMKDVQTQNEDWEKLEKNYFEKLIEMT